MGDSIAVRVTMRNSSSTVAALAQRVITVDARLFVFDASGNLLKPVQPPYRDESGSRCCMSLQPGGERVLSLGLHEWVSLEKWGYVLETPGRYTIAGIATDALKPAPDGTKYPDGTTLKSNRVEITILP